LDEAHSKLSTYAKVVQFYSTPTSHLLKKKQKVFPFPQVNWLLLFLKFYQKVEVYAQPSNYDNVINPIESESKTVIISNNQISLNPDERYKVKAKNVYIKKTYPNLDDKETTAQNETKIVNQKNTT
jgi:hypothetical protein